MSINEDTPLLREWTIEKVMVTDAIIAQYKIKKKKNLHCKYCLSVILTGVMAIKAGITSGQQKVLFFCRESCMRYHRLDLAGHSDLTVSSGDTEDTTIRDINF